MLGAAVAGLLIGLLARRLLPGAQRLGSLAAPLLGALGSVPASWLTYELGAAVDGWGFEMIPFLIGVWTSAILVAVYVAGRLQAGPEQSEKRCDGTS
ncbi:MAG: GlsB/YeaQ/YmgE family stress response membrane protein [Mycobacterium sp.]